MSHSRLTLVRRSLGLWLACLTGAITPARAVAPAAPDEVFSRYVAAVHARDMPAVRALIAADVERSDFPGCRPEMDNAACLAHYIEQTVVLPGARLTERRHSVQGPVIDALVEVRSALYSRAGSERIVGRDVLRVEGGLIRSFRFVPDFGDEPTARFFATLGIGPRAARPASPASQP